MRNNMLLRPNVVTRCAASQPTGTANCYREVRPNNNNNNNYAALVGRFQPSTLNKLRKLGFYTNMDTLDTAYHLDAKTVAAKVAYTTNSTHPSYPGGGESYRVPNTLKEAMVLPQTAGWKAASDKEIASLEKHGVFNLVPITSVPARHKVFDTRWVVEIKADRTYKGRLVVQGVS